MKLLIVSHSCVTPINQQFYAEVERQTNWELALVSPSNWLNEYRQTLNLKRWDEYKGQLLGIPVWKSGNIPLHLYRSFFLKLLRQLDPDFIYVHHEPYALATGQIYLANYCSLRKPISFFTWQNIFKRYPMPFKQMEHWILQSSCVAFPGSRSAEAVLRQKGFAGNSVVLPGGVDLTLYFPRPESEQLRHELISHPDEVLVGYVGRIVEEKGLKTLLYALQQIQSLPWKLVVVGSGPFEAEFDAIAEKLQLKQRIQRLGYVSHTETPCYLSAFDLLILPSETRSNWKEQFGRVIIEAIACGTPVIGSDSGEIPYLIEATGGGITFPEGQTDVLVEQLKHLILNPDLRRELVQQGNTTIHRNYTNSSLAQRFAQTVEGIVAKAV